MDAIFSTLNPDSGSKTRLLLAATVLSALALLLAAGWLQWLPEPAQAQDVSRKSMVYYLSYVEDDVKLSLEHLGMTGGRRHRAGVQPRPLQLHGDGALRRGGV